MTPPLIILREMTQNSGLLTNSIVSEWDAITTTLFLSILFCNRTPVAVNVGPRHLAQMSEIRINTSTTNYQKIDTSTYLPSSTTTGDIVPVKYQPTDTQLLCTNDNNNNIHDIPCASYNNNITLSKINHQKSGIEPILINNPQNVTTPTY